MTSHSLVKLNLLSKMRQNLVSLTWDEVSVSKNPKSILNKNPRLVTFARNKGDRSPDAPKEPICPKWRETDFFLD